MNEEIIIFTQIVFIDLVLAGDNAIIIGMVASQFPADERKKIIFWGIGGAVLLLSLMSLDNVLGVAGAAKDHYGLLVFGLVLSIVLMATAATLISGWIKKYKWIGWVGLLAILVVAIDLIYTDLKILII